jgi:photosystem II stability/assembly factor-like uncharacterized protein
LSNRWLFILIPLSLRLLAAGGGGDVVSPAPVAVWKQLGPFGGPAEFVVASPATPNLLFAGSPNGLLYRSVDAGGSWSHLPFPAELASTLHAILPHPSDGARLLVGVGPDSGGSGLFLAAGPGFAWKSIDAFIGKTVWALAHFAGDARIVVAGASDGLYRSLDAGETWQRISAVRDEGPRPVVSVAIHPSQKDTIYAGTTHLPWKTVNGGRTWKSIHTGMLDDSDVFSIDIDHRHPGRVVASACSGIYRSVTAGAQWKKLRGSADASFRTYVIAHDPHLAGRIWAGTTHGLIRSTDGGATWRTVSKHSVKSIAFDPRRAGTIYLATRNAGLMKSTDAQKFSPANRGYVNRSFFALAASGNSLLLSGDGIGMLASADGGREWTAAPAGARDRVLTMSSCGPSGALYAGGAGFLRQLSAGIWNPLAEPRREAVRSVACAGPLLLAASSRAVYQSPDEGRTWTQLPASDPGIEWNQIASMPAAGVLLAATSHGLLRSADGGQTWSAASGDLGRATVASVLPHPERAGIAFAAQYDHVFISSDQGLRWTPIASRGLERASVRALAVAKGNPARLYALVAGRGVFFTDLE